MGGVGKFKRVGLGAFRGLPTSVLWEGGFIKSRTNELEFLTPVDYTQKIYGNINEICPKIFEMKI